MRKNVLKLTTVALLGSVSLAIWPGGSLVLAQEHGQRDSDRGGDHNNRDSDKGGGGWEGGGHHSGDNEKGNDRGGSEGGGKDGGDRGHGGDKDRSDGNHNEGEKGDGKGRGDNDKPHDNKPDDSDRPKHDDGHGPKDRDDKDRPKHDVDDGPKDHDDKDRPKHDKDKDKDNNKPDDKDKPKPDDKDKPKPDDKDKPNKPDEPDGEQPSVPSAGNADSDCEEEVNYLTGFNYTIEDIDAVSRNDEVGVVVVCPRTDQINVAGLLSAIDDNGAMRRALRRANFTADDVVGIRIGDDDDTTLYVSR